MREILINFLNKPIEIVTSPLNRLFRGYVVKVDQATVTVRLFSRYGDYRGEAIVRIDDISYLEFDSPELNLAAVRYCDANSEEENQQAEPEPAKPKRKRAK